MTTLKQEQSRIDNRKIGIIDANVDIIKDKRILDIGANHLQFMELARELGAKSVIGIELQEELADMSEDVIHGNFMEEIDKLETGSIDTVFCLGVLYHIFDQAGLLKKIKRLRPKNIIIDTSILPKSRKSKFCRVHPRHASGLVIMPSVGSINTMLKYIGYDFNILIGVNLI